MISFFEHALPDGEKVKFSLWKSTKKDGFHYAKVIGTDKASYKKLPGEEKESRFGAIIRDASQKIVYYNDPEKLKADLLAHFGSKPLKSSGFRAG